MQSIKDFIGRVNLILKAEDPILKAFKLSQFDISPGHNFPKPFILVLKVLRYSDNLSQIIYFERGNILQKHIVVPNDFKVKILESKLAQKILDSYLMDNMFSQIYRMSMTIGSDPEMFVEDENGVVIPAFLFLGSKAKPDLTAEGTYGKKPLYWDGFQGEFETAAQTCLGHHTDSVQCGLKGLLIAAKKFNPKAKISSKTVVDITPKMLEEAKEEHVQFGCMPSLNAYGMSGKVANGRDINFRPSGGHIHFGINQYSPNNKGYTQAEYLRMVKALDAIIGVACVSLFENQDNPKRRELYGLAGEYRLPKHGLEYRVLSNAWLIHPMMMNLVFDIARVSLTVGYKELLKYWNATEEETIKCINTCDVKLAREILKRNEQMFMQVIKAAYHWNNNEEKKYHKTIFNIFIKGLDSAIKYPNDVSKNWDLEGKWAIHGYTENKNTTTALKQMHAIIKISKKVA